MVGILDKGLEPHQNFFKKNISKNMVARGVQSFGILGGATDQLIEQRPKFFDQFTTDTW